MVMSGEMNTPYQLNVVDMDMKTTKVIRIHVSGMGESRNNFLRKYKEPLVYAQNPPVTRSSQVLAPR